MLKPRFLALAVVGGLTVQAFALTSTTTSLAVTSGGTPTSYLYSPATVVLTATVAAAGSGSPVSPGQVKFCDNSINNSCSGNAFFGVAQVKSNGKAALPTRFGYGNHSLQALFLGTTTYKASQSSPATFSQRWKPGTSFSHLNAQSGATPGTYDLSVTLTGLQAAAVPAAPSATVSILDTTNGNAVVASGALVAGSGGTLALRQTDTPQTGAMPWSSVVADFNNDGIPDIAVHNGESTISILIGKGDGTFQPQSKFSALVVPEPHSLTTADFNSDGNADLAYAAYGAIGGFSIVLGDGDGTFQAPITTNMPGGGTWGLEAGDFNRDGIPDLFALPLGPSGTPIPNGFLILAGIGNGTFQPPSTQHPEIGLAMAFATADFNGDGVTDLVLGYGPFGNTQIGVFLGNGNGTFQSASTPIVVPNAYSFATGDLNGDNKLDLIAGGIQSGSQYGAFSMLGNGDGTFQTPVPIQIGSVFPASVADFNFDGIPDVAIGVTDYHGAISVWLGNGDGSFYPGSTVPVGAYPVCLPIADLNGDGKPDVVVTHQGSSNVTPQRLSIWLDWWGNAASVNFTSVSLSGSGTHNLKAYFPGDTNYRQANSATTPVTVP